MGRERLEMKKIREILRLRLNCGLSYREIARSSGVSRPIVSEYMARAEKAGVKNWAEVEGLSEEELEKKLNLEKEVKNSATTRPLPDYAKIQEELRRKYVTLMLLWMEYREQSPDGYEYAQYCNLYRQWQKKQDYCMRQEHKAGEKVFVDYCDGIEIVDGETGELQKTELFVAVWGASCFTFAEASMSQDMFCWTSSHVKALEYFQCVPQIIVPDNLRSGINQTCRYEPEINETYLDLSRHYGFAVIPARVRKPRDKAVVENGALVSQRWILAALRHRRFYNLVELNEAIGELLEKLNGKLMRKIKKSRRELFEEVDRPNAKSLPERAWEYCVWKKATVNLDYHLEAESHYYSVPYRLIHQRLDVRVTANTIEIMQGGQRIASHVRSWLKYKHTTVKEHMPPSHQRYAEWTPTRMIEWAAKTGPWTVQVVERMLKTRQHPEQAYRSALGIFRLGERPGVGVKRLENACRRAVEYGSCSYKSVRSILEKGMDRYQESDKTDQPLLPIHENIRGGGYYH